MSLYKISCCLTIEKKPIKAWDLKKGDRFVALETGYNYLTKRHEIYLKVSHTKAVLDSLPEKPEYSIPEITFRTGGKVFKLIEEWKIEVT